MNVLLFLLLWFALSIPAALIMGAALKRLGEYDVTHG